MTVVVQRPLGFESSSGLYVVPDSVPNCWNCTLTKETPTRNFKTKMKSWAPNSNRVVNDLYYKVIDHFNTVATWSFTRNLCDGARAGDNHGHRHLGHPGHG